jgi:hypothetical protein
MMRIAKIGMFAGISLIPIDKRYLLAFLDRGVVGAGLGCGDCASNVFDGLFTDAPAIR